MIPYFEIPSLHIYGPFSVQPFGVLVVTGVLLGRWFILKRAQAEGISFKEMDSAIMWAVGAGFVISHMAEVLFYFPGRISEEGFLTLFKVWDGISSMGGFIGGFLGLSFFFWLRKKPWLHHADILTQGLVIGWVFGRMGCTITSDHKGAFTDFFLGFKYPEGVRHNLGFYEMLFTLAVLLPLTFLIVKKKMKTGAMIVIIPAVYAMARIPMDFLRQSQDGTGDLLWGGFTMAQYACFGLLLVCLGLGIKLKLFKKTS